MIKYYNRFETEDGRVYLMNDLLSFSDYSGSTAERSNVEWLELHFNDAIESPCHSERYNLFDEPEKDTLIIRYTYLYNGVALFVLNLEKSHERWATKRVKLLAEIVDTLSDYPVIDDEHHSLLEQQLTEEYLTSEIPSALRCLRVTLGKTPEAEQWEDWWDSLSTDVQRQHEKAIIELFPRFREPSGESVVVFETGCVPYCSDFQSLFSDTFYKHVESQGLTEEGDNEKL